MEDEKDYGQFVKDWEKGVLREQRRSRLLPVALALSFLALGLIVGGRLGKNEGFESGRDSMSGEISDLRRDVAQGDQHVVALTMAINRFKAMFTQEVTASWYGEPFHGKETASGRIYDMYEYTGASLCQPIGSWWTVRSEKTGQSAEIEITDRGPYIIGRGLDLSLASARALGMEEVGLEQVVMVPVIR